MSGAGAYARPYSLDSCSILRFNVSGASFVLLFDRGRRRRSRAGRVGLWRRQQGSERALSVDREPRRRQGLQGRGLRELPHVEGSRVDRHRRPEPRRSQAREDRVVVQVKNGGVGMPSFRDKLSAKEIQDVASFVSSSTRTATGGTSVAAGFKPDDTTIEDCDAKTPENRCYEQAFANIAFKDGPKKALDIFDEKIKTTRPHRGGLPPDRARDRRRLAVLLRQQRGQGVRRRPAELLRPATTTASSSAPSSGSRRTSWAPRLASSARARKSGARASSPTSASTASATG